MLGGGDGGRDVKNYYLEGLNIVLETSGKWEYGADGIFKLCPGCEQGVECSCGMAISCIWWFVVKRISVISALGSELLMALQSRRQVMESGMHVFSPVKRRVLSRLVCMAELLVVGDLVESLLNGPDWVGSYP